MGHVALAFGKYALNRVNFKHLICVQNPVALTRNDKEMASSDISAPWGT